MIDLESFLNDWWRNISGGWRGTKIESVINPCPDLISPTPSHTLLRPFDVLSGALF